MKKGQHYWREALSAAVMLGAAFTAHAQVVDGRMNLERGPWYTRIGIGPEYTEDSHLTLNFSLPDVRGAQLDTATVS